jgi:hypothetical protein
VFFIKIFTFDLDIYFLERCERLKVFEALEEENPDRDPLAQNLLLRSSRSKISSIKSRKTLNCNAMPTVLNINGYG